MDTLDQIRTRFDDAFHNYSRQDAAVRRLQRELGDDVDSARIHNLNAANTILVAAEREYRSVRLEYAGRLLSRTLSE